MCGIVGTAASKRVESRAWLARGRDALRHRGPNAEGEWWSRDFRVGLAHRRLSILDLSSAGNQPMSIEGSDLTIAFNGEIYNFPELRAWAEGAGHSRWRGHSDTEVLLACIARFGLDASLRRARGMFAFALYDPFKEVLTLARDRVGEKPLYYLHHGESIYFASELKALMVNQDLPRDIDPQALDCYLACGFVPLEHCMLRGYNKLLPGHVLEFDCRSGKSSLKRYWELPQQAPAVNGTADRASGDCELVAELESLLADSTRRQLVADVPIGIMLSGGLDSSVIATLARRFATEIRTFTVANTRRSGMDESARAMEIARHIGSDHVEIPSIRLSKDSLLDLLLHADEPVNDSSLIPTNEICREISRHCAVAIGGDGGDELFGGYSRYLRTLQIDRCASALPPPIRRAISVAADRVLPRRMRGRVLLTGVGRNLERGLPAWAPHFDSESISRLLGGRSGTASCAESIVFGAVPLGGDLVRRAMLTDFRTYLPDQILQKVDRMSMRHSLEVRSPMLDDRIVEFAFSRVPARLRVSGGGTKILLRRLAAKLLPESLIATRKQGFSVPFSSWLRRPPVRDLAYQVLLDRDTALDRRETLRLLAEHDSGRDHGDRIFGLMQFEVWRRGCDAKL
jgi:asparagine synthase (glutamine-hydrolysing)